MTDRTRPRRHDTEQARYQRAVHLLQHRHSILQHLTELDRELKPAYAAVTAGNPSVHCLELMAEIIGMALREAREMAALTGTEEAAA